MIPAVAALAGRVAGGAAAKAGAGKVGQSVANYAGRTAAFKMGSSNMTTSPSEPAIDHHANLATNLSTLIQVDNG
jgi:hypothetical protein